MKLTLESTAGNHLNQIDHERAIAAAWRILGNKANAAYTATGADYESASKPIHQLAELWYAAEAAAITAAMETWHRPVETFTLVANY